MYCTRDDLAFAVSQAETLDVDTESQTFQS